MKIKFPIILILSVFAVVSALLFQQFSFATSGTISNQSSCNGISGAWNSDTNTCTISNMAINSGQNLVITNGVTLNVTGTVNNNAGLISINSGTLVIAPNGTISNNGG